MRILQVDNNIENLKKLNDLFSGVPDCCIVNSEKEFMQLAMGISFDVIVYNPATPGPCALEFIKSLQEPRFKTPVVIYSTDKNQELISSGAAGVISMEMSGEEVLSVVSSAAKLKRR